MILYRCCWAFILIIFTSYFYEVNGALEGNRGIKCKKYHTSCADGQKCYEDLRMCDGIFDCDDKSDEENCGDECDGYHYRCKSGECISKEQLCDGAFDCHSDEDENDCEGKKCEKDDFKCSTVKNCIPSDWHCDGKPDCSDGSDEKSCHSSCPDGYHLCSKRQGCIPIESFCDGIQDCDGGKDEKVCVGKNTTAQCSIENGLFLCDDKKKCLRKILVCDGKEQCDDGSDENGNCDIRCEDAELPCPEECFRTPRGPKCHCHKGYKQNKDKSCSDLNECTDERQVCDHFCENTEGSYECRCAEDYTMLDDGSTCRTRDAAMLLFSVGNDVQGMMLDGSDSFIEYKGTHPASGIAFDPQLKKVFWVVNYKKVYTKTLGKEEEPVIFIGHGLEEAENLACDWFGRNLYLTDHKKNHILVCNIEATHCKVIVNDTLSPRALQLDLEERTLYWTATGSHTIETAGLDGSNRKVIIKDDIVWPNGLALDYPAKRIYWIDSHLDQIDSVHYSGDDRKRIANRDASHPYSLAAWQDRIYWTDWEKDHHREIHSCRKRDSKHWKSIYRDSTRPVGNLVIYHPSMFKKTPNPCKGLYGYRCSHLCLLSPSVSKGYVCDCPEGMMLKNDGHNCIENKGNVPVLAINSELFFVHTRKYGKDLIDAAKIDLALGTVADMDYNTAKNMIYFADPKRECITEFNLSNKVTKTVVENIKQPTAVAVDWLRENLYWINSHHHSIELVRTSGRFRKTLIHNALTPTDLALDVSKGYLFVSYGSNLASVKKCRLNGNNCTDIASENVMKVSSIGIDLMENPARIYWTDSEKNTIESVDANGSNRRTNFHKLKHPMKVEIRGTDIFWTEKRSPVLYIASKNVNEVVRRVPIKQKHQNAGEWLMALTVVNASKSDVNKDLCFGVVNKCHQFCFAISSDQMECGCSQGFALEEDGSTCVKTACNVNQRECDDGECVPAFTWCDGDKDCTDGSDERNCSNIECTTRQYRCNDGTCIDINYKCDSVEDCRDGSDELSCEETTCKSAEWRCKSGECIPKVWRCNNVEKDCKDNSDEEHCDEMICEGKKKCIYGTCIEKEWWCDGQEDCPQGEDEQNCPCKLGEHNCDGKCVHGTKICKGEIICNEKPANISCEPSDLIDEDLCSNQIPCNRNSNPIHCIPYKYWCNGKLDCPGREDEENCQRCKERETKCAEEDACIDNGWICDGHKDCLNGSDEEGCFPGTSTPIQSECSSEEFQCPDGSCIQKRKVCDGYEDCINGVDEYGECESCKKNNGGCQHNCHESPIKITCSCNHGYELGTDKRSCLDIDECQNEDLCHHLCQNLKGKFLCSCHEGYSIMKDGYTCKPNNGEHWPLAILSNGYIKYLNENLDVMEITRLDDHNFGSTPNLVYDPKSMKMIGVDDETGVIFVQNKFIKLRAKKNTVGVAYDYINGNLYMTQVTELHRKKVVSGISTSESKIIKSTVKVYNMKLGLLGTLFEVRDRKISALKISLIHRYLFTCENSDERASLRARNWDGSDEIKLVAYKIKSCDSLALDDDKERVYWVDSILNRIGSVSYLGYNRKRFLSNEVHGPTSLTMVDHSLLWFNTKHQTLVKCSITNPGKCIERARNVTRVIEMKRMYSFSLPSPCPSHICPQICVPHTLTVPHCVCSDGFTNINDNCLENIYYENLLTGDCENNPCHEGTCRKVDEHHVICNCPENYTGKRCEVKVEASVKSNKLLTSALIIIFIIVILTALIYVYRKRLFNLWRKNRFQSKLRYSPSSLIPLNQEDSTSQLSLSEPANASDEGLKRGASKDSNDSAIVIEPLEP